MSKKIKVILACILGASALAASALLGLGLWLLWRGPFGNTTKRFEDFASNDERMRVVQLCLPYRLPNSARVKTLTYEGFQDWHLEASVWLPPQTFETYNIALKNALQKMRERAGEDHLDLHVYGNVRADHKTHTLTITCFTT